MPKLIGSPTPVAAVGNKPKVAEEFVGVVNTGELDVSITRLVSPSGWEGPGRYSDFVEYIVVLRGALQVEHDEGVMELEAGQGMEVEPGEWVKYSSPTETGAEYISVCLPAFSLAGVHRD